MNQNVVILSDKSDNAYIYMLKNLLSGINIRVVTSEMLMLFSIESVCKESKSTKVFCLSTGPLKLLLKRYDSATNDKDINALTSTELYRGSVFKHTSKLTGELIEILILPPARFITFQPTLKWLIPRWCGKILGSKKDTIDFPMLNWELITDKNFESFRTLCEGSVAIGVDIETVKQELDEDSVAVNSERYKGIYAYGPRSATAKTEVCFSPNITIVSYSALFIKDYGLEVFSGVIEVKSLDDIKRISILNLLDNPKVLQNGIYDCIYFFRYNIPMRNYLWDTHIMMHSWIVEVDRNLSFISSLFNRSHMYWKDEATRYQAQYAAKDTHNTICSWYYMLQEYPDFAMRNYAENFRMVFPTLHCAMEGFRVDEVEVARLRRNAEVKLNTLQLFWDTIVAPGFNPSSPKQVIRFLNGMGHKCDSSDDVTIKDFKDKSILFEYLGGLLEDYRETKKAIGTYFKPRLMGGRFLYSLGPAATLTGRLSSWESALWVGSNIQNQPEYTRSIYIADPGYVLNDIDNSQSESRCTAYMSEDANLIKAVEDKRDFHKVNATLFFGLTYEQIDKAVRTLAKRVNHGSNYNMEAWKLLQTMGLKNVLIAKKLLGLPAKFKPQEVTAYMLECFKRAYPDVKGKFYNEITSDVEVLGMLVGPLGWTRICFGTPSMLKKHLNEYAAHGPQSLSVKIINQSFFDCWLELQLKQQRLRFKAQVHDSLMWQDKPEWTEKNRAYISERMARPTIVRGRAMIIPNDPVVGKQRWSELKS